MFSLLLDVLCCCRDRRSGNGILDEQARLLQFQIPATPSQPIQPQDVSYTERMGTIVRTMEGKMVNLTSRLPFNLHNRVIRDSLGSPSRSDSMDYGGFDNYEHEDASSYDPSYRHFHQEHTRDDGYGYTYHYDSRSCSPSGRRLSTSAERELERPAAILNLRLVDITEAERGRARERSAKPTGLGGGSAAALGSKPNTPIHSTDEGESGSITDSTCQFKLELIDPKEMVLSSWNE